ncbi:META domain-containing protein [Geothermobacter hydrogeniphilus]|uniref:META domain-containing protein n=1 Tax=Geothermobacter hydrogeniphilus TaxID=1969733 RepID=UPI001553AD13|nr:META domain-containing protein [Geothermobacter hydrogeniphilus]
MRFPKPAPKTIAGPILALLTLVLSACGTVYPQAERTDLNGTSWALSELNGHPLQLPPGTGTPTMAFSDGMVRGSDGCNRFQGSFEQRDGRLAFGPLAATRRFCEEPVAGIEQGFNRALQTHTGYRFKNGKLELLDGERVLARFSGK